MKKFLFIALSFAIMACEKAPEQNGPDKSNTSEEQKETTKDCSIHGFAQKGQFVKGSQVTAFAVDKDLVATGESFPANISDDLGAFGISGKTAAPYMELRAEGYYFNEIEGAISSSPLYLEAFVKSDDSSANINLMTTAIRPRVKRLIKEGKSFADAVSQAQNELQKALGFTGSAGDFDDMDITGSSDADGMLLAFACMIQYGRSASEVTTLVQEIASDIESKGELSATVFDKVKSKVADVSPYRVIENLAKYYSEKKLAVNNVPAFYKYLDKKWDVPFIVGGITTSENQPVDGNTNPGTSSKPDQIDTQLDVLATINFTVEADLQGATATKEQILGPMYRIQVHIPANESMEVREVHVVFKDASGDVLGQAKYEQGVDAQFLLIRGGTNTKADFSVDENPIQEGTVVSVNGTSYTLHRKDEFYGELGVAVPKAERYEVSYPAGVVSCADHLGRVQTKIEAVNTGEPDIPYYGIRAPYGGIEVNNPDVVNMQQVLATVRLTIDESQIGVWDYLEITPIAENEFLAGTASFVPVESDKYTYPDINPNIVFQEDKSSTIRVNKDGDSEYVFFCTFPQTLSQGLSVSLYNKEGKIIAAKSIEKDLVIRAGGLYSLAKLEPVVEEYVKVVHSSFTSSIMGQTMAYSVLLPADYNANVSYPCFYLLHGYGDGNQSWLTRGDAEGYYSEYLMKEGMPMIIVFPDGLASFYIGDYEKYFYDEFIPRIEAEYNCNGKRAIGGMSMGGYGALYHALKYPTMYTYAYAMSPASDYTSMTSFIDTQNDKSVFPGFTFEVGIQDFTVDNRQTKNLYDYMVSCGIKCEYIERAGSHAWDFWQQCLPKAINKVASSF